MCPPRIMPKLSALEKKLCPGTPVTGSRTTAGLTLLAIAEEFLKPDNAFRNKEWIEAKERGWKIGVGYLDPDLAARKIAGHPCGESFRFDVHEAGNRREQIESALFDAFLRAIHEERE